MAAVRAGSGAYRRRRGAGRIVLRPGLRIRVHHGSGPPPPQAARQGPDDVRQRGALHRAPRTGRRRRFEDDAGIRDALEAHQVDHQRTGREGRARDHARRRARRGRQAEEGAPASVCLLDDAARVQGRGGGVRHRGAREPARLGPDRRAPAQPEVPERLRRWRLRGDPAGRGDARAGRCAEDRLHDRVDGDGDGAQHRGRHRRARAGATPGRDGRPSRRSGSPVR